MNCFVICLNDYPVAVVVGTEAAAATKLSELELADLKLRGERPGMYFWHIREVPIFGAAVA